MVTDLITEFVGYMQTAELSPRTIQRRKGSLAQLDMRLPCGLASATYEELRAVLQRPGWSKETRAAYLGDVRAFFRWACDPLDPILDFDPSAYLKRPKVRHGLPNPITDDELTVILTRSIEPYRLWAMLAAYGGLRCCEIARLDREHITRDWIRLLGKGDKPGTVPTHGDIWTVAQELQPGPVAPDGRGGRLSASQVSCRGRWYFTRKLGLAGVRMHRLRHWFGTEVMRSNGGDLRVTQELLRHESPATTAVYTKVIDARRTAAVAALPRIS